jgi:hypothetical protein
VDKGSAGASFVFFEELFPTPFPFDAPGKCTTSKLSGSGMRRLKQDLI